MRLAIAVTLFLAAAAHADEIILEGGGRIGGEVLEENDRVVTVLLPNGTMTIPRAKIREIVREMWELPLKDEVKEKWMYKNAVRLFNRE